jgi:hypothetical protein
MRLLLFYNGKNHQAILIINIFNEKYSDESTRNTR